mmetsp:Transcript_5175/g.13283  ORF Transcript_5175/g.13283 Transcript_5175/m.13283 type:complete len:209 (+) Transcript_5175:1156-1782(+)
MATARVADRPRSPDRRRRHRRRHRCHPRASSPRRRWAERPCARPPRTAVAMRTVAPPKALAGPPLGCRRCAATCLRRARCADADCAAARQGHPRRARARPANGSRAVGRLLTWVPRAPLHHRPPPRACGQRAPRARSHLAGAFAPPWAPLETSPPPPRVAAQRRMRRRRRGGRRLRSRRCAHSCKRPLQPPRPSWPRPPRRRRRQPAR